MENVDDIIKEGRALGLSTHDKKELESLASMYYEETDGENKEKIGIRIIELVNEKKE